MKEEHLMFWSRIRDFELDDPDSSFSFTDRLARENGWPTDFTLRVVEEYKKFIFLLCVAKHPLTPSDQVDQAWHLHLIYTQSYWIDLCQHTIKKQIHHGPTKGGSIEKDKFRNWYHETKILYQQIFHQTPPVDIWPDDQSRFADIHFMRVNIKQNWIIKKPFFSS